MDGPQDAVIQWDVVDGGMLGALIECLDCNGFGHVESIEDHRLGELDTCPTCDGTKQLHRPYYLPDGQVISGDGEPYSLTAEPEPMDSADS